MGSVPGALGGLNLGGLDLSSMLSNPALMNMVRSTRVLPLCWRYFWTVCLWTWFAFLVQWLLWCN